ncbi:MAG: hypothetical protein IPK07_06755 [Deltaproteobacteria bacterium]|nr:hypothetical protein [Deltaproteobacteria bacterium]
MSCLLAVLASAFGCGSGSGAYATREPPPLVETDRGSGIFGRWLLDADGLPAYEYTLDQHADERARFPDSRGRDRRDHVFNFGNDRLNALGGNDGTVEIVAAARAPAHLNRFDPEHGHYAGGFGYLNDGSETWSTAYRFRPSDARTRRVFGVGYFETELAHRDVVSTRRVFAPAGDEPLVVSEVTLRNDGAAPVTLTHDELWDVNLHQLVPLPSMSGPLGAIGDRYRDGLWDDFVQHVTWRESERALRVSTTSNGPAPVAPEAIATVDWYPDDVFLADLGGDSVARFTDRASYFGGGGPSRPDAVSSRTAGSIVEDRPAAGQPSCLVLRHALTLAPGEMRTLRFAYGYAAPGADLAPLLAAHRHGEDFADSQARRASELAAFSTGADPALAREVAWHSFALPAATLFHGYHGTHVTTQGSAYLYLQGIDGAPRDQALFAVPLTYLRPDLARENLRAIMRLTRGSDGQITYTFGGHGWASGLAIHELPSDLDLFFLMALSEYLAATGDVAFLGQEVPFRGASGELAPGARGTTVLDHARAAAIHLFDVVGTGPDGLIRVRDGDWSDGVVTSNVIAAGNDGVNWGNTLARGESGSNTGMALAVLPLAADVLEPFDAALAARLRAPLADLAAALDRQWAGAWYTRAILRDRADQPVPIGRDAIDLEGQPWAMIARAASGERLDTLVTSIREPLDDPSPVGAPLTAGGQVWPAVSQLLTWGYTRASDELAWRSLDRHALYTRAETFPENWIGIWTGPDALESRGSGGTWTSPVTPMTDFPAINQNPHAMMLLALLRVAGIEPSADGLRIDPHLPRDSYVLDLPLVRLDVDATRIALTYRPIVDGSRTFRVRIAAETGSWPVTVDGREVTTPVADGFAAVAIRARTGRPVTVVVPRT